MNAKKNRRYYNMTSFVFKCFRAGEYKNLKLKMDLTDPQEINEFFLTAGYPILNWTATKADDICALNFLCETISMKTLQQVLALKNYSIVENMLFCQAGLESVGLWNKTRTEMQVNIFQCLLKIDAKGVIEFMKKDLSKCLYLTESSKFNFKVACDIFETFQ